MDEPTSFEQVMNSNIGRSLLRLTRSFHLAIIQKMHAKGHLKARPAHTVVVSNLTLAGISVVTLAKRSGISKQRMGQMIKEMEQEGYLFRQAYRRDKRTMLLFPSEKGLQLLRDVAEAVADIEADYARIVGTDTLQVIKDALADLARHLPADGEDADEIEK